MATISDAAPLTGHRADRAVAAADPLLCAYLAAALAWHEAVAEHDSALESLSIHLREGRTEVPPMLREFHARRGKRLSAGLEDARRALEKAQSGLLAAYERLADPQTAALGRRHALAGAGVPVYGVPEDVAARVNLMRLSQGRPELVFPAR